jgi:exonuclease III
LVECSLGMFYCPCSSLLSVGKVVASLLGRSWWLTSVYGPSTDTDKPNFLGELHDLQSLHSGPWLLTSDFNLIYHAEDKNNFNLNRWRMGQFWRFVNEASLKKLNLNGRLFTWSSEQAHPTLERIDHVFVSKEWDKLYLNNDLQSLASICSDHTPLLQRTDNAFAYKKRFHFRVF